MGMRFSISPSSYYPQEWWPVSAVVSLKTLISSSGMVIRPQAPTKLIKIIEYQNPEIILPDLIQQYFQNVDVSSLHSNFPTIRIGNKHPFAMLLYQDNYNSGTKLDLSVFPSLTIIDSADSQTAMQIGNSLDYGVIFDTDGQWTLMRQATVNGQLLASIQNLNLIDNAIKSNGFVTFARTDYISAHVIDCNIWTENKDLTSEVFDLASHYFIDNKIRLNQDYGIDLLEAESGRRSGDINFDFGKILYGANITIPININHSSYRFNLNDVLISDIEVSVESVEV